MGGSVGDESDAPLVELGGDLFMPANTPEWLLPKGADLSPYISTHNEYHVL